jgi:hypothetical protein
MEWNACPCAQRLVILRWQFFPIWWHTQSNTINHPDDFYAEIHAETQESRVAQSQKQ